MDGCRRAALHPARAAGGHCPGRAHACGRGGDPPQLLSLRRRESGLDVEITDSGRPFDPTTLPELPLSDAIEAAHIGGLGLRLVRSYASEVTYRHDGVCNHLTLRLRAAIS